jgi:hypothetical protein
VRHVRGGPRLLGLSALRHDTKRVRTIILVVLAEGEDALGTAGKIVALHATEQLVRAQPPGLYRKQRTGLVVGDNRYAYAPDSSWLGCQPVSR